MQLSSMIDFRINWTLRSARLGMQIAFGRVRRKTVPTAEGLSAIG